MHPAQAHPLVQVVWFKRDLRVSDHAPLSLAAAAGPTLPLYVFEPEVWASADMSARHRWWVTESVRELRGVLAHLGQPLVVRSGNIISVLEDIRRRVGLFVLWSHEETGNGQTYDRDRAVLSWCRANGLQWKECRQNGVIRRLKSRDRWSERWEKFMATDLGESPRPLSSITSDIGEIPILPADFTPSSLHQRPGERAAKQCLHSFLHHRGERYSGGISSPISAAQHGSRLSPYLAWGNIPNRLYTLLFLHNFHTAQTACTPYFFCTTSTQHPRIVLCMPRANRVFLENQIYEIIPRTREYLPMPPTRVSNEIKLGIIGRTQRDNKVDLCHFVDMNSHTHDLAVSHSGKQLAKFYMEFQKKTTDAVKALVGLDYLSLWEDRPTVARVVDLADVISRIVYIYCNPSNAALCDSIEEYPGINSWSAFLNCEPSVDAEVTIDARWYPVSEIPQLPARSLSTSQDANLHETLLNSEKAQSHPIVLKPFKWLEQFGLTDPLRIENIRQQIIARVREVERANAAERATANSRCVPRSVLLREEYMKPHNPKKKERKIYLICGHKETRIKILDEFKRIFDRCKECYHKAKEGLRVDWPPGTFIPWFPPGFTFPLSAAA